jgi:F0F1-type ATP synthase membrane subunit b/b'
VDHHLDFTNAVAIPYFNFFVFAAAFVFFFRKSLLKMATSRREAFLSASKEAAESLDSARKTFDEVKTRLDSLDQELASFRQQSDTAAHAEAKRISEETERFAKQIKEETARLAVEAIERARRELRHEVVAAAKSLAAERIEKNLDGAAKEKIFKARLVDTGTMRVL